LQLIYRGNVGRHMTFFAQWYEKFKQRNQNLICDISDQENGSLPVN